MKMSKVEPEKPESVSRASGEKSSAAKQVFLVSCVLFAVLQRGAFVSPNNFRSLSRRFGNVEKEIL